MKTPEEFWSIENMAANTDRIYHPSDMTILREVQVGLNRKHILMVDPAGMGWYETKICVNGRWLSEEEAIFGKITKRKWPA